ncbi:MAG: sigma-70 family RNA polymerase sigma factor [Gemmataceae bacterium]|nr:sigma-70 family RNA polymerase sigma factor [Gemmataceae bacterium]MCI0742466.1 sigma-70 family RNA polymerase sigma factor [Gemmataceae bacterium]
MNAATSPLPRLLSRVLSESGAKASDRELLERYTATREESALAALVDRHGPMLRGLCRRLVNDPHDADDVLQATFLVLARKAMSIRRRDSLASWLFGVARRIARQARLAEAARTRRERQAANVANSAGEGHAWSELLRVLDEELQRLPERYREPLLLCYLEGRTQDEAARQLGWSVRTLRRLLEAGREKLRARMTRRGATLGAGLLAGSLATSTNAALSAELRRAILSVALSNAQMSPVSLAISILAERALGIGTGTKLVFWSTLALALCAAAWGASRFLESPTEATKVVQARLQEAPQTVVDEPPPRGAAARLGTLAFRHGRGGGALTFTKDGKHLISTGGGWIRRWDVATGLADINLGDGWRKSGYGTDLVTADGRFARLHIDFDEGGVEYDLEDGFERPFRIEFPRNTNTAHGLPHHLSNDGKTYAQLTDAGMPKGGGLVLWNGADGKFMHYVKLEGISFTAFAFAPDCKTIIVGDDTHNFRVFDIASAKELRSFGILGGNAVGHMAVSSDGKWLVTVCGQLRPGLINWADERFLRVWNLKDGTESRKLEFPQNAGVRSLVFTPDSKSVLAGVMDYKVTSRAVIRSWDVATGKPGRAWTDDGSIGLSFAISPNAKTLATMNEQGVIRLWDLVTGAEQRAAHASPCALEDIAFVSDGKTILTLGADEVMRTWETISGKLLQSTPTKIDGYGLHLSTNGKMLLSHFTKDEAQHIRLHDWPSGKVVLEAKGYGRLFSPNGRRYAMRADDGIKIFELPSGKLHCKLELDQAEWKSDWPHCPIPRHFSADGAMLVVQGGIVSTWDLQSGKRHSQWSLAEKKVLTKPTDEERKRGSSWERVESTALSPDGKVLALGLLKDKPGKQHEWFGRVMWVETATGKLLHEVDMEGESMRCLAISPDGKLLAGGGWWTVRVWDIATGNALHTFEGHRGMVKGLAFSPDGRRLASASEDSTALVWDLGARPDSGP